MLWASSPVDSRPSVSKVVGAERIPRERNTMRPDAMMRASAPVLLSILLLLKGAAPLLGQSAGSLTGSVRAAETGEALVGAEVRVVGSALRTLTDVQGRFLIPRVSAGSQVVEIGYLGRETQSETVMIEAGALSQVEFSVPVTAVVIEGVEVLGDRASSQARALSQQRSASNIINVVAPDQMGRFPDASAPEALQRVPGIAVERDQGEGRYVQIRGGSADFTQVSVNGASVPSPEGSERRVALDAVPVDILESIEVTKAITPDMDASAIGGAVNLVTRRAPAAPILSLEAGAGYAPIRSEPAGEGSLTIGGRFADDRLGVLLSGSYANRDFGSDGIEPEYDFGDPGPSDDELVEFQSRYYSLVRERLGASAALDYRLGGASEIVLTGAWTEHEDIEQRRVLNHIVEDGELSFDHKNRKETLEIASATLAGEHVAAGIELDWGLSVSRSAEDTPYDVEAFFVREDVEFSPDLSDPDRIRPNPVPGSITSAFPFSELESGSSATRNLDRIARADFSLPFALGGANGVLKIGAKVSDRDKDRSVTQETLELADGPDIVLGTDIGEPFDVSGFNPGSEFVFPAAATTPDEVHDFSTMFASQLDSEVDLEADTEDYDLAERVSAIYLLSELNLSPRLMLLPGVRYERTTFSADGFEWDPDSETLTPTSGDGEYGNLFPMAHFRYRIGDQTNLRAAVTTSIARPNFFDLVPYRIRDDEDLEIGNSSLEPTTATSWDLLAEHYDARIGLMSAGVFLKQLEDPIFAFVSDNDLGGETVQPGNGASAEIRGAELALQQQLTFLPGPFDGLGVYANYTWTDSEASLADGRRAKMAGQSDHIFNTALSFERWGFSSQLSLNYHGDYVDEYGDEPAEDVFVGSRYQLDLSGSYRVGSLGAIYVELLNLTNEPFVLYQGDRDRPRQIEFYEPWGVIGFRATR
ncbi:MAG: TonB-dependent receptor [Gemmatimonas sp.]|nr:TonB-dependent receptor [Gemmatimonas sp.]